MISLFRTPVTIGALIFIVAGCDAATSTSPPAGATTGPLPRVSRVPQGVTLPLRIGIGGMSGDWPDVRGPAKADRESRVRTEMSAAVDVSSPSLIWYADDGSATLWKMSGASWSLMGATVLTIPPPWKLVAAGDMNQDGHPDLIWENSDGMKAVTFMNGPGYGGSYQMMLALPAQWHIVAAADLSGDGKPDLVLENTTTGEHLILLMNGAVYAGTIASLPTTATTVKLVAVADIDADGKPDLIWENRTTGERSFTRMVGVTPATTATSLGTIGPEWGIGAAGDFNADGSPDLVVQNMSDGQRRILFVVNGALTGQYSQIQSVATNNRIVAAAPIAWNVLSNVVITDPSSLRTAIANAPENSRVTIPAGVYDLGNNGIKIEGKKNVEIFGSGRGQTVLRVGSSASYILEVSGVNENLSVAHMTLEGAATLATNTHGLASGFSRESLKGARYFDLEVKNVAVGISVVGKGITASPYCNDVEITGNYLDNMQDFFTAPGNTSGSGYGIHNDGCTNVRISGNFVRNADRHSIYQARGYQPGQTGPGSIVIENNIIVDHAKTSSLPNDWQVALVVARSSNVVVAHNLIINPYHDALSIENVVDEGPVFTVQDVRLIGNTVLGPRAADVYLTAAGNFIAWGNRFYHSDAVTAPSAINIHREGMGIGASDLVDPSAFNGTQATSASPDFGTITVMQGNTLSQASTTYNADPSTWIRVGSSYVWSNFEDVASSADRIFVVANRRLYSIDPVTSIPLLAGTVLPGRSILKFVGSQVIAVSGTQLFRFDAGLTPTIGAIPGSGIVHGMAAWGGKLYLSVGSCYYEVDPTTFASSTLSC